MKNCNVISVGLIIVSLLLICTACSANPAQNIIYDPAKNYAAFLVINSKYSAGVLANMKANSLRESYEIGPVEVYNPGLTDFEPVLTKLTANKQIKVIWLICSVWDVPQIKKAQANLDAKVEYRYALVSDQTGPIKIDQ